MSQYRVPRSRAHLSHRLMREALSRALDPILYEPAELEPSSERDLQVAFAQATGRRHAVACNSATSGLLLALLACGIQADDEVITVGNSDISTTAAISHCGARPVFVDILADDFTLDPAQVAARITPRTRAILPVDLYGHPADVRALRRLADAHDLRIVEDAAMALGARDHGQMVGAFADVTVFSFGAYKPLGSVGNGGMVVTDDDRIAERLRLYRGYGRSPHENYSPGDPLDHEVEGYNLPLDPLQAAIVAVKLPYVQAWTQRRREIADRYQSGLEGSGVSLPRFRASAAPLFHSYVVRVPDRDRLHRALRAMGIETIVHYVPSVLDQKVYRDRFGGASRLPETEGAARTLLCLPVAPEHSDDEIDFVVATLRSLL